MSSAALSNPLQRQTAAGQSSRPAVQTVQFKVQTLCSGEWRAFATSRLQPPPVHEHRRAEDSEEPPPDGSAGSFETAYAVRRRSIGAQQLLAWPRALPITSGRSSVHFAAQHLDPAGNQRLVARQLGRLLLANKVGARATRCRTLLYCYLSPLKRIESAGRRVAVKTSLAYTLANIEDPLPGCDHFRLFPGG